MSIGKVRNLLCLLPRLLGDVQAVRKGSNVVGKRLLRRAATTIR